MCLILSYKISYTKICHSPLLTHAHTHVYTVAASSSTRFKIDESSVLLYLKTIMTPGVPSFQQGADPRPKTCIWKNNHVYPELTHSDHSKLGKKSVIFSPTPHRNSSRVLGNNSTKNLLSRRDV